MPKLKVDDKQPEHTHLDLSSALLKLVGLTLGALTMYELAKYWFLPPDSFWASPVATILFGGVVAAANAYLVFHKATALHEWAVTHWQQEIDKRARIEADLRNELEQRVRQRTLELERRAAQLELLNDIASKITGVLEPENVFDRVTSLVHENFGYHHVGIFTPNQEKSGLTMRARAGEFTTLFPDTHHVQFGEGIVGWVGAFGDTFLANNVDLEPQYINYYPDLIPTRSELSVPIRIEEEILGVLDAQSPERDAFDDLDVLVLETLADQIAVAIVNGRLYQNVQQELRERKQAEAALRESEARYHTVSDLISDVAYAMSVAPDGTPVWEWVTGALTRISGLGFDEITAITQWDNLIHPDDQTLMQQAYQTLRAGKPHKGEIRILDRMGNVHWLSMHNQPVWDETENRLIRIIGAAREITERKQMEQQMLRAERLSAMGRITTTLAHEIKNPLQAIQSNLELATDFPLEPDEREESLRICAQEVQRLIDITQSVLSLARSTRQHHRPVELVALLQQTFDVLRQSLQKAAVEIKMDLASAATPPVIGDEDQLRQVLLNLVLNAIEAMDSGGILTVTANAEPPLLHVSFTNNGPPIPTENLEHLFEPFFTTKPQGTGMGLFISHHIIQQLNGNLHVKNLEDDQGVVFTMTLPIAEQSGREET